MSYLYQHSLPCRWDFDKADIFELKCKYSSELLLGFDLLVLQDEIAKQSLRKYGPGRAGPEPQDAKYVL